MCAYTKYKRVTRCDTESCALNKEWQISMRFTVTSIWFNKESNWFLWVHHHNILASLLFCCELTVIILEKEKVTCGISNADAERQVARLQEECFKLCYFVSISTPPTPKVKARMTKSQFNSSVQNLSRQTT